MLSRLARWWLARGERRAPEPAPPTYVPRGECEAPGCGLDLRGDALHVVAARATDDAILGITSAEDIEGTGMSADFCAEHCPGGCQHGCVPSPA